jgi:hypothetical protein
MLCRWEALKPCSDLEQRNFRFISILGFSSTAMSTWEIVLSLV